MLSEPFASGTLRVVTMAIGGSAYLMWSCHVAGFGGCTIVYF